MGEQHPTARLDWQNDPGLARVRQQVLEARGRRLAARRLSPRPRLSPSRGLRLSSASMPAVCMTARIRTRAAIGLHGRLRPRRHWPGSTLKLRPAVFGFTRTPPSVGAPRSPRRPPWIWRPCGNGCGRRRASTRRRNSGCRPPRRPSSRLTRCCARQRRCSPSTTSPKTAIVKGYPKLSAIGSPAAVWARGRRLRLGGIVSGPGGAGSGRSRQGGNRGGAGRAGRGARAHPASRCGRHCGGARVRGGSHGR
jgi:hypothetical protein